jgi:manganese efflux pump family protein
LLIAVGLAMDAFAVSLGIGTTQVSRQTRSRFRLAFHFGLFQCLMPIIGWFAGSTINRYISSIDHWVAFGLLGYVGINMLRSGLNPEKETYLKDPSRGKTLMVLTVATSIDALAVGLSLAMIDVQILAPSVIIGVVTFGLSLAGLFAGNILGEKFGKRMEIIGGLVLLGIGFRVLITHLF